MVLISKSTTINRTNQPYVGYISLREDLDMLMPAEYNTIKAICGMSTRSAHTEMKSHRLRASSCTPAPNVAGWKPHRGNRELKI